MSYDDWKLATPPEYDDDRDEEDRDDYDTAEYWYRKGREIAERGRCVLGAECCCPHPFHGAAECFDVSMAEAYFAELADEIRHGGNAR